MSLYFWQAIGYGILAGFFVGLLAKIFNAIAPVLRILFFIVLSGLAVVSYLIALLIRVLGYRQCPSLFPLWNFYFDAKSLHQYGTGDDREVRQSSERNEDLKPYKLNESTFDPWTILQIPRNASAQEIKAAYRKMIALNHPDKVASLDTALHAFANQRTVLLKKAYEQLSGKA